MEFTLLGKRIEISEGRKNYMKILAHYNSIANKAKQEFSSDYENTFGLTFFSSSYAEKFSKKYSGDELNNFVMTYVRETRKYLATYGVYTLTDQEIWNEITKEYHGVSRLQYTLENFIVDNVSDDTTDKDIVPKIKSRFESGYFHNALNNDIMSLCDFVLNYLCDNKITDIQFVYKKDASEAEAIYKNLLDANISASEQERLAYSLIELDPRSKLYYEHIFCKLPQAKYEIAAIAKYLSIDLSDLIEKDILRQFDHKSISCEEDALKMMTDLNSTMERFGVFKSSRKTELEKILHDFDIKAKTYDGVQYATRELRNKAERDDQELHVLYGNAQTINKENYSAIISDISNSQRVETIKEKYVSIIKNRMQQLEMSEMEEIVKNVGTASEEECNVLKATLSAYKTFVAKKDMYFKCIEDRIVAIWGEELSEIVRGCENMTENECGEAKEKIEAHRAPTEMKKSHIDRIDNRICTIWDEEDFERFTEIFTQTRVSDSEQVGKNCVLIRESGRTETKELFIKALYLLNEAEVEAAAKYAVAKDGGLFASLINMGKKSAYETLTLGGRVMHPAILTAMEAIKEKKSNGILSSFGFGKNRTKQQPAQAQNSVGAKFCSNCGAKIDSGAKFCSGCGTKL